MSAPWSHRGASVLAGLALLLQPLPGRAAWNPELPLDALGLMPASTSLVLLDSRFPLSPDGQGNLTYARSDVLEVLSNDNRRRLRLTVTPGPTSSPGGIGDVVTNVRLYAPAALGSPLLTAVTTQGVSVGTTVSDALAVYEGVDVTDWTARGRGRAQLEIGVTARNGLLPQGSYRVAITVAAVEGL